MQRLSKYLGGPSLWVKRDDCTGLGLGGKKVRKLSYSRATQALPTALPRGDGRGDQARRPPRRSRARSGVLGQVPGRSHRLEGPAMLLEVETRLGRLSFLGATTVFGMPADVTLDEIALQMLYRRMPSRTRRSAKPRRSYPGGNSASPRHLLRRARLVHRQLRTTRPVRFAYPVRL
jgi:hypothetical protein